MLCIQNFSAWPSVGMRTWCMQRGWNCSCYWAVTVWSCIFKFVFDSESV